LRAAHGALGPPVQARGRMERNDPFPPDAAGSEPAGKVS